MSTAQYIGKLDRASTAASKKMATAQYRMHYDGQSCSVTFGFKRGPKATGAGATWADAFKALAHDAEAKLNKCISDGSPWCLAWKDAARALGAKVGGRRR